MTTMLCWNRVSDYARWRRIFDSHTSAHHEAGLKLRQLWRTVDDPNRIFFIFEVRDIEKARSFINAPGNEDIGKDAGVLDGAIWFLEDLA